MLFNLDVVRDAGAFKALGATEVHQSQDDGGPAVVIDMKSPADTLLLPEFDYPSSNRFVAHMDITSPAAGLMSIFYKRDQDADYVRKQSYSVPLTKGRNQVYVEVEQPRLRGALRLRPGDRAGRYTVQAFEVRALPPR